MGSQRPQAFHRALALALALAPVESVAPGRSLRPGPLLLAPQRMLRPPQRPQAFHRALALAGYSAMKRQLFVRQMNRLRPETPAWPPAVPDDLLPPFDKPAP